MQTHLEVQQREDIRRDPAERMKFVSPDLRVEEGVFFWQEHPSKIQQGRKSGKWLKVEIIAVKGSHGGYQYRCDHFSCKRKKAKKDLLETKELEELLDSRERAEAPVL